MKRPKKLLRRIPGVFHRVGETRRAAGEVDSAPQAERRNRRPHLQVEAVGGVRQDLPRHGPEFAMIGQLAPFPLAGCNGRKTLVCADQCALSKRGSDLVPENSATIGWRPHPLGPIGAVDQAQNLSPENWRHLNKHIRGEYLQNRQAIFGRFWRLRHFSHGWGGAGTADFSQTAGGQREESANASEGFPRDAINCDGGKQKLLLIYERQLVSSGVSRSDDRRADCGCSILPRNVQPIA